MEFSSSLNPPQRVLLAFKEVLSGSRYDFHRALGGPLRDVLNSEDSRVDVSIGVERPNREAHAAVAFRGPKLGVDQGCAMQPGAGCDVVVYVKHHACVSRIHAFYVHQDGGQMVVQAIAAIEFYVLDLAEAVD